jgi:hypothetical protein
LYAGIRDTIHDKYFFDSHRYDKREVFTLSDGGETHIDFKGRSFVDIDAPKKPIVFLIPGLTSFSGTKYIIDCIK